MNRLLAGLMSCILGVVSVGSVQARPVLDCPLRDAPYSIDAPLIDVLLNPAAKALIDQHLPELFLALPPRFFTTQSPSFSAILTVRAVAEMKAFDAARVEALGMVLRRVPVAETDRIARCARYDDEKPILAVPPGEPRLLLFEKMTGFRDGPSVDAARIAFQAMAKQKGWAIVVTDKGGAITPSLLRRFDAVIWDNVSGDVLTLTQRKALKQYIEGGGGFVAVHGSAGDPVTFWDWYTDDLIGARFAGHPMKPQFQDARIVLEKGANPVAQGLPPEWTMNDEWYSFKNDPRAAGASVIATLDEDSYSPVNGDGRSLKMGDHPIAWTRCIGKGRMAYSAIGHRPETYADPNHLRLLENAVLWAVARGTACSSGK